MTDVKRLNYFTSQFLVEKDFKDEQGYFVDMRRRHNQLLHTWGVADGGLQVLQAGDKLVTVGVGMAVDKDGREIVLLEAQTKDLTAFGANADVYLTLTYQEVSDPADHYTSGGIDNYTRITERPLLDASTTAPATDGSVIVLAKVALDDKGNVGTIDGSVRRLAGSAIDPAADLVVGSLSVGGNADVGGKLGIGTTAPGAGVEISKGATNDLALLLNSSGPGWGSGLQLKNTAKDGKTFGIYSGSGSLHAADVDANIDRLTIDQHGNFGKNAPTDSARLTFTPQGTGGIVIGNPDTAAGSFTSLSLSISQEKGGSASIQSIQSSGSAYGVLALNPDGGNVGIGTTAPTQTLTVAGSLFSSGGDFELRDAGTVDKTAVRLFSNNSNLYLQNGATAGGTAGSIFFRDQTGMKYNMAVSDNGNVGIGTTAPSAKLTIDPQGPGGITIGNPNTSSGGFTSLILAITSKQGGSASIETIASSGSSFGVLRINSGGGAVLLGGRLEIAGDLTVHGAKSGYVVDRFINGAEDTLEQGDVVVIGEYSASVHYGVNDTIPVPEVDITASAYDTRVCGIVCDVHLEESPEGMKERDRTKVEPSQTGKMVTLGAFAHCKVDADIAPIKVGDLLTTSPTKGHAQKVLDPAKAVGAIIGKALGSVEKGKGKIPVLVMLQ
jgi:hypothetical protein